MNFFEAQERARTQTSLLVVLFVAALLALTALTTILVVIFLYLQSEIEKPINIHEFTRTLNSSGSMDKALVGMWSHFSWTLTGAIALGIMAVVVIAASFKTASLASGGKIVAEMLDGELIDPSTNDLDERKVLNVVQEMAIASGVPVPSVYLLPENAINAFAAGDQPHNTVIGVTRGSVSLLSRDELQGVIAHEFSHIFNGDMKLNMQLTSVLFGILVIGQIGEGLVRASFTTKSKDTDESKKLQVLGLGLGLGLIVIGYAGSFFGNLIKAAICRQREFLADATSVQYTRDPTGIAGALKKIGGYIYGSDIESPHAHEVSHFFFGAGVRARFLELDTHPPLTKRILAIEPRWAGDYPIVLIPALVIQDDWVDPKTELKEPFSSRESAVLSAVSAWKTGPESGVRSQTMITSVGAPSQEHLEHVRTLLTTIPEPLVALAREPYGCRAVILLLLSQTEKRADVLHKQMQHLKSLADENLYRLVQETQEQMQQLDVTCRLPLLEMAVPAFKMLSKKQNKEFMDVMMKFIRADYHIAPYEWALYRIISAAASSEQSAGKIKLVKTVNLNQLQEECCLLISVLALGSSGDSDMLRDRFDSGWRQLELPRAAVNVDVMNNLERLDLAVERLCDLAPLKKLQLLQACCASAQSDSIVTPEEVELVRAIAGALNTPMPPLLLGQTLH
jgi:Zn-dependent protease with chaperone function/uncharacterized tellurite resistance protein B-like protein